MSMIDRYFPDLCFLKIIPINLNLYKLYIIVYQSLYRKLAAVEYGLWLRKAKVNEKGCCFITIFVTERELLSKTLLAFEFLQQKNIRFYE